MAPRDTPYMAGAMLPKYLIEVSCHKFHRVTGSVLIKVKRNRSCSPLMMENIRNTTRERERGLCVPVVGLRKKDTSASTNRSLNS